MVRCDLLFQRTFEDRDAILVLLFWVGRGVIKWVGDVKTGEVGIQVVFFPLFY